MVFASLIFLCIFMPLSLVLYYISPNRHYRNGVLILASLVFYAWGEPKWISILLFITFFCYLNGIMAEKYKGSRKGKVVVALAVAGNLMFLVLFKYTGFFLETVNSITRMNINIPEISLPIGISFYTFQTISYVVDVYRGEVKAQKNPFKLLLYVSMFHQLIAGPIVRYRDIAEDIEHREETWEKIQQGVRRFSTGLAKKVLLANIAGDLAKAFLDGNLVRLSVAGAWTGILLYAFQIYFDFSGYSDMAIGLGKMFGFTYKENFNYPYISKSFTEFWRRWHISLSSFFRDYLYIPLGGNRKNHLRNLFIVWFSTGLWHGASWNFVLWGIFNFVFIFLEKVFLGKLLEKAPALLSRLYFIVFVLVGWTFFYFTDTTRLFAYLGAMFGAGGRSLVDFNATLTLQNNLIFIVICIIACVPVGKFTAKTLDKLPGTKTKLIFGLKTYVEPLLLLLVFITTLVFMVSQTYNPFLYFRF
ncbi:MAG: MBOAT family protein [Clostridiaceae bacterium]|nr:MBOAT family protein [Clostridiaceae bacterium]